MPKQPEILFDIHCPKCQRVVDRQPIHVTGYHWPRFICKFCDYKGTISVWKKRAA